MIWSLLLLAATPVAAAESCRAIDSDRIRAADFAASLPAFRNLDPEHEIAPAPAPGARRMFQPAEVLRLAQRLDVKLETAAGLCFQRTTLSLTAELLRPILEAALGGPVQILEFSRQTLPSGKIEFDRTLLSPSGFWRGRVTYGEGRSAPVWVRIPAKAAVDVQRGDRVEVEVTSGGVLLGFTAPAESSGRAGDTISVKSPINGRRVLARVTGKGKASIHK